MESRDGQQWRFWEMSCPAAGRSSLDSWSWANQFVRKFQYRAASTTGMRRCFLYGTGTHWALMQYWRNEANIVLNQIPGAWHTQTTNYIRKESRSSVTWLAQRRRRCPIMKFSRRIPMERFLSLGTTKVKAFSNGLPTWKNSTFTTSSNLTETQW